MLLTNKNNNLKLHPVYAQVELEDIHKHYLANVTASGILTWHLSVTGAVYCRLHLELFLAAKIVGVFHLSTVAAWLRAVIFAHESLPGSSHLVVPWPLVLYAI